MQGMSKGGPGGMDEDGIKSMMHMIKECGKDPEMAKQMEGMMKMMDDMLANDPAEY